MRPPVSFGTVGGRSSDHPHVHPSTLTGIPQRLTTHGLLHRIDDPRDRRRGPFLGV
jgi:hypothetical protein